VRTATEILTDLATTSAEAAALEQDAARLRRRLGMCLAEAHEHDDLTIEAARRATDPEIPRQTAYRLLREHDLRAR
jgi:hypothetical protein